MRGAGDRLLRSARLGTLSQLSRSAVSSAFNRSDFPFPKVASEFLDGDNKNIRTCYQELSRGWSGCVP